MIIRGFAGPDDRDEVPAATSGRCPDAQVREMDEILKNDDESAFLAERPDGGLCSFLRRPSAPGRTAATRRLWATSRAGSSMRMHDSKGSGGPW